MSGGHRPLPPGDRRPQVTVTRTTADQAEVVVSGIFDVAGTPDLLACLDELVQEGCTRLVVDLTGVTFADASALGVLVRTRRRLEGEGGALQVVHDGNRYVERLLELTGLQALFE